MLPVSLVSALRLLSSLIWLVLLVAVLKLFGYLAVVASDLGVTVLWLLLWVPLLAVLFWRARRRRAVALSAYLTEHSRWRHRLRGGLVMAAIQAAAALPLSILLLAVISQPQAPAFWWLMLFAVPLWLCCWQLSLRLLRADVSVLLLSHAAGVLAVRMAGVILVLLWLLVSLWLPVADVSSMTLFQAARLGMAEAAGESQALVAPAAIWHGFSYVHLWLVQTLTTPSSLLSLLAWMLLLVQGACFVWPLLLLMQGVSVLCNRQPAPVSAADGSASPGPLASPSLAAATAVAVLLMSWVVLTPRPFGWLVGEPQVIQLGGSRYALPADRLDQILRDNADWLDGDLAVRFVALQRLTDRELDRLFADARARVPGYADWHYSLSGGMTRTAFGLMEYFSADNERAVRMLSERLFPAALWQRKLQVFEQQVEGAYDNQLAFLHDDMLADLQRRLAGWEAHPHLRVDAEAVINLDRIGVGLGGSPLQSDLALRQSGVSMALGAGAAAFSLTHSVRAAAQSRATAQGAARAGARLASRGSAAGGATFCAASGPLVLGCAVAVFTGVTLASEYAILKADELLSRQQLEADLLASVEALQDAVGEEYLQRMLAAFRQDADHLHGGIVATLRPVDRL
ncbi:MAG: hypothetical protein ACK4SX_07135 [Alcanivoracaceae bacterium]